MSSTITNNRKERSISLTMTAMPPSGIMFYTIFLAVLVLIPYNYLDVERFVAPCDVPDSYLRGQIVVDELPSTSQHRRTTTIERTALYTRDPHAIRKWGCHRQETPTIFVHLAKAGGGSNRARFAAAAVDYNRSHWHSPEEDDHHYRVTTGSLYGHAHPDVRQARFCNSMNHHQLVPYRDENNTLRTKKVFEGSMPCNATSPLGLAVACPQPFQRTCNGCDLAGENCDTVYVGHNYLGSELHWLPPKYLKKWWESNWVPSAHNENSNRGALAKLDHDVEDTWKRLGSTANDTVWCDKGYRMRHQMRHGRPSKSYEVFMGQGYYQNCVSEIASEADERFHAFWEKRTEIQSPRQSKDYSEIYASMPLQRTTVMREPWSWVGSKFFWHKYDQRGFVCDRDLPSWMYELVRDYLLPFCGVDCTNRLSHGMMTFEEVFVQAESNLRQSFSVVGLLNGTSQFYEMVSTRIGYLDMTRNPHVEGMKHESGGDDPKEVERCKALFMTREYQEEAKRQVPEMELVENLFRIGVEVNRFQKEELSRCSR